MCCYVSAVVVVTITNLNLDGMRNYQLEIYIFIVGFSEIVSAI